jgi:arylsulfatase A-like enzyme
MFAGPHRTASKTIPAKPSFVLLVVVWCSLFSSLIGSMFHLAQKRLGMRGYLYLSQDFVWMTAVMDLMIFLPPALLLALLSWRFRRQDFLPAAIFVGSFLFLAKLLILLSWFPQEINPLLALCLAVQLARQLKGPLKARQPFLKFSAGSLAIMFAVLALAQLGAREWAESQALAQLHPAHAGAPNILLITLDTVSAQHMSLHGFERQTTPHLDRWAKKGTWFNRAMSTAPWTLPSHASMFTGRYPHELSTTRRTPLDATCPTMPEVLTERGYVTAGFVANRWYTSYESGLDRGFIHYEDFDYSIGEFSQCSDLSHWFSVQIPVRHFFHCYDVLGRKSAADINRSFLGWLDRQDAQRPYFAFLNFFDAHDPYVPPPPFDTKFGPPLSAEDLALSSQWWDLKHSDLPPAQLEAAERAYDSCLAYLDDQLGQLLDEMQRRGLLDNTLVIVTSDHGEHFGEHHLYLHGQSLYRDLIHVPLILIQPGRVPAGQCIQEYITLRDLAATVFDLAGIHDHPLPGSSLARYWGEEPHRYLEEGDSPLLQVAFPIPEGYACPDKGCSPVASGSIVSLFRRGKHYIKNITTGQEEMYDFEADPRELHNRAALPEEQPLVEEFRRSLEQIFRTYKSHWIDFPEPPP